MSPKVDVDLENGEGYANENVDVEISDGKNGDKKKKKGKKEKEEKAPTVGFGEYYKFSSGKEKFLIFMALFWAMIKGAQWPLVMVVFGMMIDDLTDPVKIGDQMNTFALLYVGAALLNIIAGYFAHAFMLLAAEGQCNKIRVAYFRAIMRQEIGWFDERSSGELTTRLSSDIEKIKAGMSDKVSMAVQWITAFFAGFIIAFCYEWRLSLVIMSTSPLLAIGGYAFSKIMESYAAEEQTAYAAAGAVAEEVFGAIRTVVSFGGEKRESKRYDEEVKSSCVAGKRGGLLSGGSIGFTMMVMFGTYGLAFWYGAKLCGEGKATPGDILIAFFNILIGSFAIGHSTPHFQAMAEGRGAAHSVFATIDRESKINYQKSDEGKKPASCQGRIEFRGVQFFYPTRKEVQVMQGFSVTLDPGKTHALVGPSGCGKSTAVGLLERFYDVEGGEILLDGVDIRQLNLRWLREQIGLVGQEPVLFATTIEENIRYGREDVTQAEIEEACKKSFAHDFIMKLPDKYQSLCGERGSKLSGGQKQRIAIARALVRNPKILLLDEATSALDTESEKIVQKALEAASEGRTTLVIAHRLSTIINANKISAIAEGKIVEEGTHKELLAKEGLYHTLVTYQAEASVEGVAGKMEILPSYEEIMGKPSGTSISKKRSSLKRLESKVSVKEEKKKDEAEEEEEEVKIDPSETASFFEIMRRNNAYENVCIIVGTFGAAVNGATMPVFAVLFSEVIAALAKLVEMQLAGEEPDYSDTNKWAGFFAITGLVSGIANFLQVHFMNLSGVSFTSRMRCKTFHGLLRQNIEFFDRPENSVGALTTRLATDANNIKGATGVRVGAVTQNVVGLGVGIGIAFYNSWKLSLVTLACIPFVAAAGSVQMLQLSGTMGKMKKLYEEAGKTASESIENMRTVVSLNLEERFIENYRRSLAFPTNRYMRQAHLTGLSMGLAEAAIFFTYAGVFYYGNYLIQNDGLTFTRLIKVFSGIVFAAMTIGQTMSLLPDYTKAKHSAYKIFQLMGYIPPIDAYSTEGSKPEVRGVLGFDNVKFDYPTRADVKVLQGLSFNIDIGKTIALVGQSGCGKSTSVQLTQRFYDVLDGVVSVDGMDIRKMNVAHLRQQMGLVSQEPVLFDCSIEENIKYGALHRKVSDDEVRKAAIAANINNFIVELPEGYKTRVGEKGTQLSGGQKQRIAIARALVRNPKILLLDEATSALDTESEKVVQEALDKAREGRTCLVIAHRLSTIQNADLICVIQEGRVVEMGTHKDLLAMKGVYYNLNKSAN